jgi:hypothetical protein
MVLRKHVNYHLEYFLVIEQLHYKKADKLARIVCNKIMHFEEFSLKQ